MGKTFRNIVLASTGDFGDKTDKIKNWVEHAGGRFTKEISKDVTHLVASHRAWKKYHPMGKSPCSIAIWVLKVVVVQSSCLELAATASYLPDGGI